MIVVLSDLHLSETKSTRIGEQHFNRNIPPDLFRNFLSEISSFAKANHIQSVDLVLAGDILEISRSGLWFQGKDRPYVANNMVLPGSSTEAAILTIIDAITEEKRVKQTLALFRNIQEKFSIPVTLHYILGNHDRLVNATPAIRSRVREIFGLGDGDELFKHHILFNDPEGGPFCLVRHGHEYDSANFGIQIDQLEQIPTEFSEEIYGSVSLGDVTSIEFGGALPYYFVEQYGENDILHDKKLKAIYRRLIEFDDVRPTSALLSFLFSTPGVKKRKTWEIMRPCFMQIIHQLQNSPVFRQVLRQSTVLGPVKKLLVMALLNLNIINLIGSYPIIKRLMKLVSKKIKLNPQVQWAMKEALIQDRTSGLKCVVSGHTHTPEVALISSKYKEERYYINTGTWRNQIPSTSDYQQFGHLRAITKVMIFLPNENPEQNKKVGWSFHFRSGESLGNYKYY